MITQNELKKLFEYKDGKLYWRISLGPRTKIGALAGCFAGEYYKVRFKNKYYMIHRVIFMMFHGYLPKQIDHINNIKTDNRIENLRAANNSTNQQNVGLQKNNKSGIKGVSWHKATKKWVVQLGINGKPKHFGCYFDKEVARFVAETMRYKYHKEFANHGK